MRFSLLLLTMLKPHCFSPRIVTSFSLLLRMRLNHLCVSLRTFEKHSRLHTTNVKSKPLNDVLLNVLSVSETGFGDLLEVMDKAVLVPFKMDDFFFLCFRN